MIVSLQPKNNDRHMTLVNCRLSVFIGFLDKQTDMKLHWQHKLITTNQQFWNIDGG